MTERELLAGLSTEQRNPTSARIDAVSNEELLRIINDEDRKVAEAVESEIPSIARALDLIVDSYRRGGRLFYSGAGTSGRLGALDAAEIPPTYGEDPARVQALLAGGPEAMMRSIENVEDSPETGADDLRLRGFTGEDVLVGIAASGRTPYVIGAMEYARSLGAKTVSLTTNPEARISQLADVVIAPVVGPEVVAGSTRMKSGTAQKLVLNMLSTGLMIRTGHVYGNLMVNVQLKNAKLWDRARRIVVEIAGCDSEAAERALQEARDVRTAILMLSKDLGLDEARARLAAAGGVLREALK